MTSTDEIKSLFEEAKDELDNDKDTYRNASRSIVNVERQSIYGDEPPAQRLKQIREIISGVASSLREEEGDED